MAKHTLKPWSVASAMFAERLKVSDKAVALMGTFSPENVFAKTEVAVITGKLAQANLGAAEPLLSLKLLRGLKVDGAAIADEAACAKVLATVCSAAHRKLLTMAANNALPLRCEAGCIVNPSDATRTPTCTAGTRIDATASTLSERCARGLGAAAAASPLL